MSPLAADASAAGIEETCAASVCSIGNAADRRAGIWYVRKIRIFIISLCCKTLEDISLYELSLPLSSLDSLSSWQLFASLSIRNSSRAPASPMRLFPRSSVRSVRSCPCPHPPLPPLPLSLEFTLWLPEYDFESAHATGMPMISFILA